jgi:hypothetical protein
VISLFAPDLPNFSSAFCVLSLSNLLRTIGHRQIEFDFLSDIFLQWVWLARKRESTQIDQRPTNEIGADYSL